MCDQHMVAFAPSGGRLVKTFKPLELRTKFNPNSFKFRSDVAFDCNRDALSFFGFLSKLTYRLNYSS